MLKNKEELIKTLKKLGMSWEAYNELNLFAAAYFHIGRTSLQEYALGHLEEGPERSHIDGCDTCLMAIYVLRSNPWNLRWDIEFDIRWDIEFDKCFPQDDEKKSISSNAAETQSCWPKIKSFLTRLITQKQRRPGDEDILAIAKIIKGTSSEEINRILALSQEIPSRVKTMAENKLNEQPA